MAHIGIVSHSKLLLSVHSSHYSVKAIDEQDKLSVNIIDEAFLAAKLKPVLFEMPTYKYLRTGDSITTNY